MRNKFKSFCVIAIAAVIVLTTASCASTGGSKGSEPKTLVITGITGYSGDVLVDISSNAKNLTGSMVAVGGAAISGGSVTVPLVTAKDESKRWNGSGEYYIVLVFHSNGNVIYFYSQGGMSALKYNFSDATSTIPFNQFRKLDTK